MTKQLIEQANVLVNAATTTLQVNFALINDLRTHLKRMRSQVTVIGNKEDVEALNICLAVLPKSTKTSEKVASMEWTAFNLWVWGVCAKKCPSALLKRQMDKKHDIFMRHANYVQKEEYRNIYSVVEDL